MLFNVYFIFISYNYCTIETVPLISLISNSCANFIIPYMLPWRVSEENITYYHPNMRSLLSFLGNLQPSQDPIHALKLANYYGFKINMNCSIRALY